MKKIISISLLIFLSISLTSCFDLGGFEQGKDDDGDWTTNFYDYFDTVTYYKNFEKTSLDMTNFFNEESFEDKDLEESSYFSASERDYFQILVIPAKQALTIGDFYIYLDSDNVSSLDIDFYVTNKNVSVKEETITGDDGSESKVKKFDLDFENGKSQTISLKTELDGYQINFFDRFARNVEALDNLIMVFNDNLENDSIKFRFSTILISKEN